eukprot:748841-Hanusia_phi.AAC.1
MSSNSKRELPVECIDREDPSLPNVYKGYKSGIVAVEKVVKDAILRRGCLTRHSKGPPAHQRRCIRSKLNVSWLWRSH